MNRRPPGLKLSKAISGFVQHKTAAGLAPTTIQGYERDLKKWAMHIGDVDIGDVTTQDVRDYLAWLRTEYKPQRWKKSDDPLSPKTLRNVWVTLSAFFRWASIELDVPNPMKAVPAPRFEQAPVEPFTQQDIEALLKACEFCKEAKTTERRRFTMRRATAKRDRAIILTLLDTGLRASELCALNFGDLEQKTGKIYVKHGVSSGAKGGKGRAVFLAEREDGEDPDAPLFMGKHNRPLNKDALRHLMSELGAKAQVAKCHPHRLRHIFAITYLRSGGDVFTLQALPGHGSLDMVQHYARIAEVDIQQAHRRHGPAELKSVSSALALTASLGGNNALNPTTSGTHAPAESPVTAPPIVKPFTVSAVPMIHAPRPASPRPIRINGLRQPGQSAVMPSGRRMSACHRPSIESTTPTIARSLVLLCT